MRSFIKIWTVLSLILVLPLASLSCKPRQMSAITGEIDGETSFGGDSSSENDNFGDSNDDSGGQTASDDESSASADSASNGSSTGSTVEKHDAIVTAGKDWSFPETVDFSPYGTVYAGYDSPAAEISGNKLFGGTAVSGNSWNVHQPDSADQDIGDAVGNLDGWFDTRASDKKIWLNLFTGICGGDGPEPDYDGNGNIVADSWLKLEGADYMSDVYKKNLNVTELGGYNFYKNWYLPIYTAKALVNSNWTTALNGWLTAWNETYGMTYAFWDADYLKHRRAYFQKWKNYLAEHDSKRLVGLISLTGECAVLDNYLAYKFLPSTQLDLALTKLIEAGLFDEDGELTFGADDEPRLFMGIAKGGRAYKVAGDYARKYKLGLGMYSFGEESSFRFLQHFPNLRYDSLHETYVRTGEDPLTTKHLNLMHFAQYDSTVPGEAVCNADKTWDDSIADLINSEDQYRLFEVSATTAVAFGFDSLMINGFGIPSQGTLCESDPAECECVSGGNPREVVFQKNWSKVENLQATAFVEWLNKVIDRPANDSPEAFCSLTQSGNALPSDLTFTGGDDVSYDDLHDNPASITTSDDFYQLLAQRYQDADWYENGSFTYKGKSYSGWKTWTGEPIVAFRGFHCLHDRTLAEGASEPDLAFTDVIGDKTGITWAHDANDYLARKATSSNPYLYFRFADDFAKTDRHYVIKIFFENPRQSSGSFETYYHSKTDGWKKGPPVAFDPTMTGPQTASLELEDADFGDNAATDPDFAIYDKSDDGPAFLMIRTIKVTE